MIINQDIICFSFSDWDQEMVSNRYQMLTRFAKKNRVFLFEMQLIHNESWQRWAKFLFGNPREKDGIYLIIPGLNLPWESINRLVYRYWLKKVIKKFHIKKPIFWFYNYRLGFLLEKFPHQLSCYHCTEDYSQSSRLSSAIDLVKEIEEKERQFVQEVDLVFAVSQYLARKNQKTNPQTFLTTNAVDYKLYRPAQKSPQNSLPVLGYIGNLSDKVNFQLLYQVAKAFTKAKIVLVGPVVSKNVYLEKLGKLANVSFLGRKPVQELPKYLATFDVCLIPFIQDEWFVKCSQPLKLYEYLASGKPIVSTLMDCLAGLRHLVYIGKNKDDFISLIRRALKEKDPKLRKERIRLASQNTWDKRFAFINQKMEEVLCQRKKS